MLLDIDMKQIDRGISRDGFKNIWGEVEPSILGFFGLVVFQGVYQEPRGENGVEYVTHSNPQDVHDHEY